MARIPIGTDSHGNVLPDGRVTIGLSDGSKLTGSESIIRSAGGDDAVVITTRLSRVPADLDTSGAMTINTPDGEPLSVVVSAVDKLPDGSTQITGRIPGGAD